MPRTETVLTVFVASPSDVTEERERLEIAIAQLNAVLARRLGVRLELLRWEQDATPSFDEDSQSVINKQIPNDYDIFLGIFWHRIGTPTSRAQSGTVEEFELAKARHDLDPNSVRLMIYFKTAGTPHIGDIDPNQYQAVVDFRSRVSKEGGLYSTFRSVDDFANQVQLHLIGYVLDWLSQGDTTNSKFSIENFEGLSRGGLAEELAERILKNDFPLDVEHENPLSNLEDSAEDEFSDGLLDLEERVEEEFSALLIVLKEMGDAVLEVGNSMNNRSDSLQALLPVAETGQITASRRKTIRTNAKRVMNGASTDMNKFVSRMEDGLPSYKHHLNNGLGAFTKAIPIYLEINQDRPELKTNLTALLESMDDMLDGLTNLRDSVRRLPRATSAFAKSRHETERVLQEAVDATDSGKASLSAALLLLPL